MSGFWILVSLLMLVGLGTLVLLGLTGDEAPDPPPDDRPLSEVEDPDLLLERAEYQESQRDWEQAANTWSRFIQVEPDRSEAYFRRAVNAYRDQRYQRALEDFETVLDEVEDPPAGLHLHAARAARELNRPDRALSGYESYLDREPEELEATREAVDYARSQDRPERARGWLTGLRESGDSHTRIQATLDLVELALEEGDSDRAESYLDELKSEGGRADRSDSETTRYLYLRGRWHKLRGETRASEELFRRVYRQDPTFRDVQQRVEEQFRSLDESQLVDRVLSLDSEQFRGFAHRVVESMGYEVTKVPKSTPEEVDLVARQQSLSLRSERVLFTFKKWKDPVAEIPVKEFEYKMVEGRYETGYFATPGGFKTTTEHYAQGNQKLNLLGPDDLLQQLREWYSSD